MKDTTFHGVLAPHFEEFVALKRACGARYGSQAGLLAQFDRHLVERRRTRVDRRVLGEFLASLDHLASRSRDNLVCVVWQALEHAQRHRAAVSDLPPRPSARWSPRVPYVLTKSEIDQLLQTAARRARAAPPICPATYSTLFGLLLATGLRVGEAVALDVGDVDLAASELVVRMGKFRKARLVPLSRSTSAALRRYLLQRRRLGFGSLSDGALFVTATGRRFSVGKVWNAFRRVVDRASIRDRIGRRPRVHDLRHTFAVHRVIAWHREGRDVNYLLSLLSTYMGHVGVRSTQVYLQPTAELLAAASRRFEAYCATSIRGRRNGGA